MTAGDSRGLQGAFSASEMPSSGPVQGFCDICSLPIRLRSDRWGHVNPAEAFATEHALHGATPRVEPDPFSGSNCLA
jgi:hypothetical protein